MASTELRNVVRRIKSSPGFSIVVVLTIAIGVGGVVSAFSLVQAVLLRPLPFADPTRLVRIHEGIEHQFNEVDLSAPDIATFARENRTFTGVAGFIAAAYELNGAGAPFEAHAERVSASLFPLLQVAPAIGRSFDRQEDETSAPVAVIGYALWRDRFQLNPSVLGRTIELDRRPYTVIGVMPPRFEFPLQGAADAQDLWVPLSLTPLEKASEGTEYDYAALARLRPGVTLAQAQTDVNRIIHGIQAGYPASVHLLGSIVSLKEQTVRDARPLLRILLGAVSLIMLIASANLANLFIVRAMRRRRELGIRMALGSTRSSILLDTFMESGLLGLIGGTLGLLLALAAVRVLPSVLPASLPRVSEISANGQLLNWQLLALALGLVAFISLVCSAAPMLLGFRGNLLSFLHDGSAAATPSRAQHRVRTALVVAESALAMLLLVASGLLLHSFQRMLKTDPGFSTDHAMTAALALPAHTYSTQEQVDRFYRALHDKISPLPGVTAVGFSTNIPLVGMNSGRLLTIKGYAPRPGEGWPIASNYLVQGSYFHALRIPLLQGRFFNSTDDVANAPLTAIVSQSFASRYWPRQDVVGKEIKVGTVNSPMPWITVVGVVGDVKQDAVDKATTIEMYEPLSQAQRDLGTYGAAMGPNGNGRIVVRTAQAPSAMAESLQRAVRELDPLLPLSHIETLNSVLSRTEAPRRFDTYVFAAFAGIALFLALLGMYGVIASVVNEQTRSIAIRMALGATRESILGRTIFSAVVLASMGLAIGLCAALGLGRFMSSLLYGVAPQDPVALGAAVILLLLCAFLAGLIPARRAAAIDPIALMRSE